MKQTRRQFVQSTMALGAMGLLPRWANAATDIKLGSLLDRSGVFDAYGKPMDRAERLAVAEINADGGINGRTVTIIP